MLLSYAARPPLFGFIQAAVKHRSAASHFLLQQQLYVSILSTSQIYECSKVQYLLLFIALSTNNTNLASLLDAGGAKNFWKCLPVPSSMHVRAYLYVTTYHCQLFYYFISRSQKYQFQFLHGTSLNAIASSFQLSVIVISANIIRYVATIYIYKSKIIKCET